MRFSLVFCIVAFLNIYAEPIVFTIEFANANVLVDGTTNVVVDLSAQIFADTNDIKVGGGILGADRYDNITSLITISGLNIINEITSFGFLDIHPADIISGLPLNNFILTSANLTNNIAGVAIDGLSEYDSISNFDRTTSDLIVVSTGLVFAAANQNFLVSVAEETAFTAQLSEVPEPSTYLLLFFIAGVFLMKRKKLSTVVYNDGSGELLF